jgi:DNA-binding Lrp family transcriptional regulator
VATGMGAIAHGNDYGGSIRYPAWACGVVGLRTTVGRIPSYKASALNRIVSNQTRPVAASLLGEPGVAGLHDTNGRWDLVAELRAESNAKLSSVVERVRLIKGIAKTETSILLATYR